jgi:hypothetical protein
MDEEYLIDYTYEKNTDFKIWNQLTKLVDELIENPRKTYQRLNHGFEEHLARSKKNHQILKKFLLERGWDV